MKKCSYYLKSRGDQEDSPDVVNDMLKVFSSNVYTLLEPSSTLAFANPLVAKKFYVLLDILVKPF